MILTVGIFFTACQKERFKAAEKDDHTQKEAANSEGTIVLGSKLNDPYALENMKQAYKNLKATKSNTLDLTILPTHKYVRFLPHNETEWAVLKSDTDLVFFDFPLDYEVLHTGTSYHDPELPEASITWQYCVLPIDYPLPNLENELLYEVYFPEEDENLKNESGHKTFFKDLEYEAMKISGNLSKYGNDNTKSIALNWTPKGHIRTWDNIVSTVTYTNVFDHWECYNCKTGEPVSCPDNNLPIGKILASNVCKRAMYTQVAHISDGGGYIPLIGASVQVRFFTKIRTDLTDVNGYFETAQFNTTVNYSIKWERGEYTIRDGVLLQAWFNGPWVHDVWNLDINSGKSVMFATMHRAAYKQFYGDNLGIQRPFADGKAKLCYKDESGTNISYGDWPDSGVFPDIIIYGKFNSGNYIGIDQIFGTTTHELGHLSHWLFIGIIQYAQTDIRIYESWADAVEWALTNDEYHKLGVYGNAATVYDCPFTNQQDWPSNVGDIDYTPIFIDLMDDENQRITESDMTLPNDLITGYTLSFIQNNILVNSYGVVSLRDAIKSHKINGVTDASIDELFALYWTN